MKEERKPHLLSYVETFSLIGGGFLGIAFAIATANREGEGPNDKNDDHRTEGQRHRVHSHRTFEFGNC